MTDPDDWTFERSGDCWIGRNAVANRRTALKGSMSHDNADEPTVKQQSHPWAVLEGDTPLFHVPGTYPPEYAPDAALEPLWLRGQRTMQIPSEYLNQIVTGDARVLAERIPDESVDLIFTDPVYSEKPLYDLLGSIARRVLKPTGAVLCWSNGKWHRQNANWLEAAGLTYRYDFGCVITTGNAPMNGKIISKTNRIIWLDVSGKSKMLGYLADGYASATIPRLHSEWAWTKNPIYCEKAIEAFTRQNVIVLDPFAGHGTLPAVAKIAGRRYIGFEIDEKRAAKARTRLANTQAIDPVFLEEQAPLFAQLESEAA